MADITVIATTLGTAAITGAVGAWAGFQQASTARAQLGAENRRFRVQLSATHRRECRDSYQQLLNATHEFGLLGGGYRPAETADVNRWLEEFQARLHAVELIAGGEVLEAAEKLDENLSEVLKAYRDQAGELSSTKRLRQAYEPERENIHAAYRVMRDAMRDDLDQTGAPLDGGLTGGVSDGARDQSQL